MIWRPGITIIKDPNAIKNYKLDLRGEGWLVSTDNIASHTMENTVGVTVDSSSNDNDVVTAVVSGGTAGESAQITFRVVTDDGWVDDFTVKLTIAEQ